ncbi:MAG: glutathione peroxidase [Chlamydiae bacterium]|nr:MAG: glutathione peroxidase [Chlamydiota bacterium]
MTNIIYEIPVKTIDGQVTNLAQYVSKVMLIVNTASKCGYTPQYKGLETLYEKYKDKGFVVLGFPCNQFMSQEPGTEAEIKNFCNLNFGVSFPMFSKINVNGNGTHPLYKKLKQKAPGIMGTESIKWNFTKFLVSPNGKTIKRFSTATKPEEIESKIVELLKKTATN